MEATKSKQPPDVAAVAGYARNIRTKLGYSAAVLAMAAAPLFLSDFRLNLLAKFLALAIVAVGLDMIWGYTGILSLGHGVFFGWGPTRWRCI